MLKVSKELFDCIHKAFDFISENKQLSEIILKSLFSLCTSLIDSNSDTPLHQYPIPSIHRDEYYRSVYAFDLKSKEYDIRPWEAVTVYDWNRYGWTLVDPTYDYGVHIITKYLHVYPTEEYKGFVQMLYPFLIDILRIGTTTSIQREDLCQVSQVISLVSSEIPVFFNIYIYILNRMLKMILLTI